MPLLPLEIPPGVYSIGTDYEAAGRWRDANLVRWRDGSLRPIGGWQKYTDSTLASVPRSAHAWRSNLGDRYIAFGSYNALRVMRADGSLSDITPTGLIAGELEAELMADYGASFYGLGVYGIPVISANFSTVATWSLDNWGENLVACSNVDGKLYEWTLNTASPAAAIANAPIDCSGLAVTEERFLFALGAGGNPRKVQWSDRENNTAWTAAATNEAGDFELQTPGEIMQAVRDRAGLVILTDSDAHVARYQGPPFVYGFERAGMSCGAISRQSAVSTDQGVFWMGRRAFYRFAGGAVEEVPCDVHDMVFDNLNKGQSSQIWAVTNSEHSEVWWFYPPASSTGISRYVALNYATGAWTVGELCRTAGVDRGVFRRPIWTDGANIYEHESGNSHGGAEVYAETGPISIGAWDNVIYATQLIPDELSQGDAEISFKTRFYPNANETEYGPYALGNPTSVRFSGRQVRMRIEGVKNKAWRAGVQRLHVDTGGRR